jgi:ribonuclease HI
MGTRVFTDGSAVRNGSPNACGGIGVWFADDSPFNIAEGFTSTPDNKVTNQSMELIAGIMALESIEENDMDKPITLCTDSEYVINCVKWAPGWKKSGWLTKLRRPVLNRELIERLVELVESTGCILVHVMSHQTLPDDPSHPNYPYIYGNSRADELAKEGASAALKSTRKQ